MSEVSRDTVSNGKLQVQITASQKKAAEATNYPSHDLPHAVRKHGVRVKHAGNDRLKAVLNDRFWGGKDTKEDHSSRSPCHAVGGRERIFCATVLYFELLEEGHEPETSNELEQVCGLIGSLIRAWTYYEFPIAKLSEVARVIRFELDPPDQ